MFQYQLKFRNEIIPNYFMNKNSEIYSMNSNKILKPFANKEGRPMVMLLKDKKKLMFRLDYLVISSMNKYRDDIIRVIHIDDNDKNCNISNLMVITKSDIIEKYKTMYAVDDINDIPEEWKIFTDEPLIEVSNFGNVRNAKTKEPFKIHDNHGYKIIYINHEHYQIHRIVATMFVENPKPKEFFYVNYIDGNKENNVFYNLEWCNVSMNADHAYLTGLYNKYSEEDIRKVCKLLSEGLSHIEISNITGVNRKLISDIYRGRCHKNIAQEYVFIRRLTNEELYNKDLIIALLKSEYTPKQIADLIHIDYNDSFSSFCNRLKKNVHKIFHIGRTISYYLHSIIKTIFSLGDFSLLPLRG